MDLADPTSDLGPSLAALSELLRELLGAHLLVDAGDVLNRRDEYVVLRVTTRSPTLDLLVKLAGPRAPHAGPFERTARLHQIVRAQTAVPVAEVIAAADASGRWPWRYLVTTIVPGETQASVRVGLTADDLADVHRQLGDAVGQLHGVQLSGFGEIEPDVSAAGPSWHAALAARARSWLPSPALADLFVALLDERADLLSDDPGPRLCHDDLHHSNILLRHESGRWRLAALLDFDKAWAGHHETDLAKLDLWRGMTSPAFWSAYRERQPVGERYIERRPLYQLLWCLEYPHRTPRHLADTRLVCADLGLDRAQTNAMLDLLAADP